MPKNYYPELEKAPEPLRRPADLPADWRNQKRPKIGPFQGKVLCVCHSLPHHECYAWVIRKTLDRLDGKNYHMPQVYSSLTQLQRKRLLESHLETATSGQHPGKRRRLYRLSDTGKAILWESIHASDPPDSKGVDDNAAFPMPRYGT